MRRIYCFILLLIISACKPAIEIDPCLVDPLENNTTLKRLIKLDLKHNLDSNSINLYTKLDPLTKQNENYFVVTNSSPIVKYNFIANAEIISCNGNDIAEFYKKESYLEFFKSAKFVKRLWHSDRKVTIQSKGTCGTKYPLADIPYFVKLNANLDKYAWKSIIYQYKYKDQTIYYGLYTPIDHIDDKYVSLAAMTCEGVNLQDLPDWNQADFLENAVLESQIR